jgi:hypothetical protein
MPMSLILRFLSWLSRPRSGPRARRVAANENAMSKTASSHARAAKTGLRRKSTRAPVVVHVMGHHLPICHVGKLSALELWNLSDPARVAVLYLQHGRRLRLPAPQALADFGKAVRRARVSD